jgi:tripartite-type tricarboxylate transporter receptor subunit TctC
VQIVPFRNSPDIVVGLLRGDVQMMVDFPAAVKGQVDDRKLRLLATSGPRRSPSMPNLATVAESGVAGYEVTSWNGLFAPRGTPPPVVAVIAATLTEVLAEVDVRQQLLELGIEARPSSPGELMALFKADVRKWGDVIASAGIEKK